ncbi:MAG: hypothetical protein AAF357_13140, partial [Verrucomicrobiota bacterium]
GNSRPDEYKVVLRAPGQKRGEHASFSNSDGRLAVLVGYSEDFDVFVLWDASLHERFKNGTNTQVKDSTVSTAAATGWATQERWLRSVKSTELVIACRPSEIERALELRIFTTGGVASA